MRNLVRPVISPVSNTNSNETEFKHLLSQILRNLQRCIFNTLSMLSAYQSISIHPSHWNVFILFCFILFHFPSLIPNYYCFTLLDVVSYKVSSWSLLMKQIQQQNRVKKSFCFICWIPAWSIWHEINIFIFFNFIFHTDVWHVGYYKN